jgi:hypothetical protein
MKRGIILLSAGLLLIIAANHLKGKLFMASNEPVTHTKNHFEFQISASMEIAAPLFGPEGERTWAGNDWNPSFVYPAPARDIAGAVFTLPHQHTKSTWVNTMFDLKQGRMQYVYFIPDVLVTLIDVSLTPVGTNRTAVSVTYERTALNSDANEHVRRLAKHDAESGAEWQSAIERYLAGKQR